jgi:hypothetical protein
MPFSGLRSATWNVGALRGEVAVWLICPMQSARTVADGSLESRIALNEHGKPIRIGRDGRVDSQGLQSIGHELCALLEKPDGSVEIVESPAFLKRISLAAHETADPIRNEPCEAYTSVGDVQCRRSVNRLVFRQLTCEASQLRSGDVKRA